MNRTQPVILTFLILLCYLFTQRLAANEISNTSLYLLDASPYLSVDNIIPDTICAGTCKIIGGQEYCESGSYTVTEDNGDSYLLELVVLAAVTQNATQDICQGDTYLGEERNQVGTQIVSYQTESAAGCDMTVVVILTVHRAKSTTFSETIKYGTCKDFGPNRICQSGEYTLNYGTVYGCDSTVQINLTVEEPIIETVSQTICAGQTFAIKDTVFDQSGLYQLWEEDAQGRTIITTVDLIVEPEIVTQLIESSCEGQPFIFNGMTLTESGSYEYTTKAVNGCDSLVQLELSVGTVTRTDIAQTIPRGESVVVGRNNVTLEGAYEFVYQSIAGCDSIVYLEVSFDNNGNTTGSTTGGGTTTGGGGTTTGDGGGTTGDTGNPPTNGGGTMGETGGSTGNGGGTTTGGNGENPTPVPCDEPETQAFRCFEEAPYRLGDNTFWEGGTFNLKIDAEEGCPSQEITLNLVIEFSRDETLQTTICEGESFEAGGISFTEAIDTTLALQSVSGCDSTLNLELNIATSKDTMVEKTICLGDPFRVGGRYITASGQYEELYQTIHGCDSLVRIDLTVDGYEPAVTSMELCAGECLEDDIGNKACVSGTYNFRFQSATGCDSIVTVELLIPDTVRAEVWDTFCKGDVYQVGIFAVSQAGRYRDNYINDRGCDSITSYNLIHVDCEISSLQDADTVICGGNTGQFSFSITKGQYPFMYKWTSEDEQYNGSGMIEDASEEIVESNLPGGIYAVTVTDRFDAEAILEIEIIRPEKITATFATPNYRGVNFACANDSDGYLQVIPAGGVPPFSYEWSNGSNRRRIDNLPSGDYSVTITDHYNCSHSERQSLKEPPQLVMLASANDPICEDINTGSIAVDMISGGVPPYQYRLTGNEYEDVGDFSDLGAGDYQLLVRDANNCLTDSTLSIVAPDIIEVFYEQEVTIELGDQLPLEIFPSHPAAMVEWVGPEGLSCYDCLDPIVQPLETSSYAVTITSEDDCTTTATLNVRVAKERDVYIPNAFSPNRDGINDRFTIYGGPEVATVNYFRVYSRWGELLFEKNNFDPNDPQLGWDGQFNGQQAGQGVYIWIAQLTFIDNVVEEYSGDVLLSK